MNPSVDFDLIFTSEPPPTSLDSDLIPTFTITRTGEKCQSIISFIIPFQIQSVWLALMNIPDLFPGYVCILVFRSD